jgi:hypothetical protein
MTLVQITQDDFGVGTLRGTARDVQPGVGVHRALNALVSDEGDLYLRGATRYWSNTTVAGPLTWTWSGALGDAQFVLFASPTTLYRLAADQTPTVLSATAGLAGPVLGAVVSNHLYLPNGFKTDGTTVSAWTIPAALPVNYGALHVASIAGRLVVGAGNRLAFSPSGTPDVFVADDFHELPGGTTIMGLFAIQDTLLVFTDFGLWSVTNMAYDLTDAAGNIQQSLSLLVPGLSLGAEAGLCGWQGRVVAACVDRVCFVSLDNAPVTISDSIASLYSEYARFGVPGGMKVFNDTLFLPMLTNSGDVREVLTCRLNRPVRGRQTYYPWTEFDGHAGQQSMFDFYVSPFGPMLLGAGTDGRLNDLSEIFNAFDYSGGGDADGTAPLFELETRDFPTGQGQPNHLKRIRLRYTAQGTAPPNVQAAYSTDPLHATWADLNTTALTMPGEDPLAWWLPQVPRARYARVRVRVQDTDLTRLIVHRVDLSVRPSTHAR